MLRGNIAAVYECRLAALLTLWARAAEKNVVSDDTLSYSATPSSSNASTAVTQTTAECFSKFSLLVGHFPHTLQNFYCYNQFHNCLGSRVETIQRIKGTYIMTINHHSLCGSMHMLPHTYIYSLHMRYA